MTSLAFTQLDIGGPVAPLSLDHSGGNRINFDMRVELREAVQRVEKSPARALLIRGVGGEFCLGVTPPQPFRVSSSGAPRTPRTAGARDRAACCRRPYDAPPGTPLI
ncbi:MAG: hypothetical protein QOJ17_1995 [Rhodospirillaceae bacterium]|nr:hypothetical protein [Rhodospirillaceae bacterium]